MVMGNMGSAGGIGIQGPPGPPGPPGGIDLATTPFAVFARAVLPPAPGPGPAVGQWTPLDFSQIEQDLHLAIQTGTIWRFRPPYPGTYLLQAGLVFQPVGAQPLGFSLRFVRNNVAEEIEQAFTLSGPPLIPVGAQLSCLAKMSANDVMHVEVRNDTGTPLQIWPAAPHSAIVIQGVGVGP